jgi:TusA-related sulfurtransferase
MTLVKVKLQLSKMVEGECLEVTLSDGEPLKNVPRTVEEHGHKIIETTQEKDNLYKIIIEK